MRPQIHAHAGMESIAQSLHMMDKITLGTMIIWVLQYILIIKSTQGLTIYVWNSVIQDKVALLLDGFQKKVIVMRKVKILHSVLIWQNSNLTFTLKSV